ncbi:MAG: hypothetical protein AVDCRST_MAG30-1297, partial [uncultured Solirubrobacteraceae bacterium]
GPLRRRPLRLRPAPPWRRASRGRGVELGARAA